MALRKSELSARINSMSESQLIGGLKMVRAGYGAHGMTLEHDVTLKQANACHEAVRAIDAVAARTSVPVITAAQALVNNWWDVDKAVNAIHIQQRAQERAEYARLASQAERA